MSPPADSRISAQEDKWLGSIVQTQITIRMEPGLKFFWGTCAHSGKTGSLPSE